jgi:hypothetical protein
MLDFIVNDVNATNAPARSQSIKAMFNLFQFQGG